MSRPVVYIAGPIRAASQWQREANIRRAEEVALGAWRAGAAAICPHAMTRSYCEADAPAEVWLEGDLAILARCDAVLVVQGWERSNGARAEVFEARRLGIPVLESVAELVARLVFLGGLA